MLFFLLIFSILVIIDAGIQNDYSKSREKINNKESSLSKTLVRAARFISIFDLYNKSRFPYPKECISIQEHLFCSTRDFSKSKKNSQRFLTQITNRYFPWSDFESFSSFRKYLLKKISMAEPIPGYISFPKLKTDSLFEKKKQDPKNEIRGVYISIYKMRDRRLPGFLQKLKTLYINGIVFDIKNVRGNLSISPVTSILQKRYNPGKRRKFRLENFLNILKKQQMHSIARISVFKDSYLAQKFPHWAAKTTSGNHSKKWLDPSLKVVQDHHISLAKELAIRGVDEIQLDYVRFPYPGELPEGRYVYTDRRLSNKIKKHQVITNFLKRLREELKITKTLISADLFGITAWKSKRDIYAIGQNLVQMADYLDILSPMLYPSHFSRGFKDFANPADHPEYFIFEGTRRIIKMTSNKIPIRPWLQSFKMRVTKYDKHYILKQINSVVKANGHGYLLWNSSNRYDKFLAISPKKLDAD